MLSQLGPDVARHIPPLSAVSEMLKQPESAGKSAQPFASLSMPSLHWGTLHTALQSVSPGLKIEPISMHCAWEINLPVVSAQQHPCWHWFTCPQDCSGKKKSLVHSLKFDGPDVSEL